MRPGAAGGAGGGAGGSTSKGTMGSGEANLVLRVVGTVMGSIPRLVSRHARKKIRAS
jgi:hypothetical protein